MKTPNSSYNKLGLYFFLGTTIFSIFWVLYYIFINNSIDLGETSSSEPSQIVQAGSLTEEEQVKPWLSTKNFITHGSKVYKAQCALCHGVKGLGDGIKGLIPPPRNLVEGRWKQGGSSKNLFITLGKGVAGSSMVSFQHLSKIDRWALVHYMRSITKNKVSDNMKELEEFAKQAP